MPGEARPSLEESRIETEKRLAILERIKPELEKFCDAMILIGSMSHSKNHSVRKTSDIDLLLLIEKETGKGILESNLFSDENKHKTKVALDMMEKDLVQHFTLVEYIDDIEVQFHFWEKEAEYKASRIEIQKINRLTPASKDSASFGFTFTGEKKPVERKTRHYQGSWYIQDYPVYTIIDGALVPCQPITNLLNPTILFTKDQQLYKNIEILWRKKVERLVLEHGENVDLSKANVLFSHPAHNNFSPEVKEWVKRRTEEELHKLISD